jgi:hypothetical protein
VLPDGAFGFTIRFGLIDCLRYDLVLLHFLCLAVAPSSSLRLCYSAACSLPRQCVFYPPTTQTPATAIRHILA